MSSITITKQYEVELPLPQVGDHGKLHHLSKDRGYIYGEGFVSRVDPTPDVKWGHVISVVSTHGLGDELGLSIGDLEAGWGFTPTSPPKPKVGTRVKVSTKYGSRVGTVLTDSDWTTNLDQFTYRSDTDGGTYFATLDATWFPISDNPRGEAFVAWNLLADELGIDKRNRKARIAFGQEGSWQGRADFVYRSLTRRLNGIREDVSAV